MRRTVHFCFLLGFLGLSTVGYAGHGAPSAAKIGLPVKSTMRVKSSKPREGLWLKLSEKQKNFAYHIQRAARFGRRVLVHQSHRHGLKIQAFLESALSQNNLKLVRAYFGSSAEGKAAYQDLLAYAAKFADQGGPYAPANRKYYMQKVHANQVEHLFRKFGPKATAGEVREIGKVLSDPAYEALRLPEETDASDLVKTGGNLYQKGLTGAEVEEAVKAGLKIELNCQIVRSGETKKPICEKQTVDTVGPVGEALTFLVQELRAALPFAETSYQNDEVNSLIAFFEKGDVEDFRKASIAWVKDRNSSPVDFILGYIEVYTDYRGQMGAWESYMQFVDPETTRLSASLAKNAQYFEDKMPYGQWKKKFPKNYSPPALMVYYYQEISDFRSSGYNLPNFDDIRRDVGFKNIIKLDMPGEEDDPVTKDMYHEAFTAFLPKDLVEDATNLRQKQYRVIVLLHEIIGHGSGTYDISKYPNNEDPISALGAAGGSALEEQRADLAALVFAGDPKLIDVGVYKDEKEAKLIRNIMYESYLGYFLLRTSKERSLTESHQRGQWLFIKRLLAANAIGWVDPVDFNRAARPETQVLRAIDYEEFYRTAKSLLAELQLIKATRNETQLRKILAEDAPLSGIDKPWAKAVIARGEDLAFNAGVVDQPWMITPELDFSLRGDTTLEGAASYWWE